MRTSPSQQDATWSSPKYVSEWYLPSHRHPSVTTRIRQGKKWLWVRWQTSDEEVGRG